jgi:hypothetical protein
VALARRVAYDMVDVDDVPVGHAQTSSPDDVPVEHVNRSLGSVAVVVVNDIDHNIWALQKCISAKFYNGDPLLSLIQKLESGELDPMTTDWLILRVAACRVHDYQNQATVRYYTFDHRRLWCMHRAGCDSVRVRIALCGPEFDELVMKADNLGRRISEVKMRW